MEHLFIVNPRSIKDMSEIDVIGREAAHRVAPEDSFHIHVSRYPRDAVGVVAKYAEQFKDGIRIYAVGGDGILFDCLNGMVNHPAAELASVPYGRTNDFARALGAGDITGFPPLGALLSAPSVPVDIVHCGSNYFINFCSVGVESSAADKWYRTQATILDTRNKRLIPWITALSGIVTVFDKKLANQYYNVRIDDCEYDGRYVSISFSNGPYCGGNWSLVPEAIFNDGLLDVLLVKNASPLQLLRRMPGYLTGNYTRYPDFITHIRAREISIRSERPMFANLDGECFIDTKLTLKLIPSAVRVIAARGSPYIKEAVIP